MSKIKSVHRFMRGMINVKFIQMKIYSLPHILCHLSNSYRYKGGICNKHWIQTPAKHAEFRLRMTMPNRFGN